MSRRALLVLGVSLLSSTLSPNVTVAVATTSASTSCSTALFFGAGTCYLNALDTNAFGTSPVRSSSRPVTGSALTPADLAVLQQCRATFHPPTATVTAQYPSLGGGWYSKPCLARLGVHPTVADGPFVFLPSRAAPSAAALARQAQAKLVLPAPAMYSSPGPAASVPKVVNFPTWAWIAAGEWRPVTASVSAGSVTVTATAAPRYVHWSWGDGTASTCLGPGAAFTPGLSNAAAASPDCGHRYGVTSASGPGEEFPVTATVHWSVTWSANTGEGGQFPDMTTSAAQSWPVEQIRNPFVPVTG